MADGMDVPCVLGRLRAVGVRAVHSDCFTVGCIAVGCIAGAVGMHMAMRACLMLGVRVRMRVNVAAQGL